MAMQSTYQGPAFDPTVDELETLKQLEMGNNPTVQEAIKGHVSGRLLDAGFITRGPDGLLVVTPSGLQLIRRQ